MRNIVPGAYVVKRRYPTPLNPIPLWGKERAGNPLKRDPYFGTGVCPLSACFCANASRFTSPVQVFGVCPAKRGVDIWSFLLHFELLEVKICFVNAIIRDEVKRAVTAGESGAEVE